MGRFRCTTAGESHGPAELAIVAGVPAGLALTPDDVDHDLQRRQGGYGRGGRMAIERDRVRFLSGVRQGRTLGTPIAMLVENRDHASWRPSMQAEPLAPGEEPPSPVTVPRPGHADLSGLAKFDHDDIRDVLERASARETVGRVAAGGVAKRLLSQVGVHVRGRVLALGSLDLSADCPEDDPRSIDWPAVDQSEFGTSVPEQEQALRRLVDEARETGESLGGVFEVWAWGVCPGLGSYALPEQRLDGRLMGAVGSVPAIKGVEIGLGFRTASLPGSAVHDPIVLLDRDGRDAAIGRSSNRAGGLEGGVTTGQPIVVRAAMKPIPTLTRRLPSVDVSSLTAVPAHHERSDVTAVAAARVVGEAMVAIELADAYLDKFGGDSMQDLRGAVKAYEDRLAARGLWRRS